MHVQLRPDNGVQWAPIHEVYDAASPEVRQAIEHIQRLSALPVLEAPK
jgi:hypothetical protein